MTINVYMEQVKAINMLSKEEEYELAKNYAETGNINSAQQLVLANLRYVVSYASKFKGYNLPLEDLIQEGNIGLMKAVKKFDYTKGVKLITYAVYLIRSSINEYIINNWKILKTVTTKAHRKLFFNLRKYRDNKLSFSETDIETISNDTDVVSKTVKDMEQRLFSDNISFEDMQYDNMEGDSPKYNFNDVSKAHHDLTYEPLQNIQLVEKSKYFEQMKKYINNLDARTKYIIQNRWLSDNKPTLTQLGQKYNISAEGIRQIEQKGFKKIRQQMNEVVK